MSLYIGLFTGLSALRSPGLDTAVEPVAGGAAGAENLDVLEAIMDLQVEEVAYQATLQAVADPLPETLVSFLR